ncbi:MAG: efflux transporter periplasmic adaptor subunit [Blastopirellula sp.]|nr:efflux transporter periplasmic adaptor subunit [Blastopirellula sp.]
MKTFLKILVTLVVLAGLGGGGYVGAREYWKRKNAVEYREAEVIRGGIVSKVNATGEVKPVLSVPVGAFVSGPITGLYVEFNSAVKKGDVLAEIDTRIYEAALQRDLGSLSSAQAEVSRVTAQLELAKRNEKRANLLQEENEDFVSQAELDQLVFATKGLEAQLELAKASVQQAEANLQNSRANLDYTKIRSPVDGMVIDRKIDEGQTLAAQFQTPELFVIGKDMRKEMYIHVSVDESEIGLIKNAQTKGSPVEFRVYAYPEELFEGRIVEIRMSHTTNQNVVTYPVIVSVANPDLKLVPGMTAEVSFEVDRREDCVLIPNTALRFFPEAKRVREEDQGLIDGTSFDDAQEDGAVAAVSVDEQVASQRKRKIRHVWVAEGDKLRAVEIVTGLTDSKFTELVSGDLEPGQKLIVGLEPKNWGRD